MKKSIASLFFVPFAGKRSTWRLGVISLALGLPLGWGHVARGDRGTPGMPFPGVPDFTLSFDENGNGNFNGQPLQGISLTGGGIEYIFPVANIFGGDVLVTNPLDVSLSNPNGVSDLLDFFVEPGIGSILIYTSLLDDTSPPDLADVPILNFPTDGLFFVAETGPEGNNGFTWLDPTGASHTAYIGISDVPEPTTTILAVMGLVALLLFGWRHRAGD
jgi:hypothetical protein